ncbi:Dyp-type peroxidase [Basilea psittacipulmonis]|uniref:Dyp-type peroxidase C-terminal domain-containing protein n=1 Tax=Basilea psittacipulmonis DSM 24701 TaxID=1072685 RepID=A0A077DGF2_9BURK|nr:Dyp-type peroxidase [Basilea psittacipulmonis]AIL33221.1 hypothetical protein IX83_07875 [Basilea psittacipulmonis DSM 24701]
MQPGIMVDPKKNGRYLTFDLDLTCTDRLIEGLKTLQSLADGDQVIVGIGHIVLAYLKKEIPGFRPFPVYPNALVDAPIVPAAVWIWLRDDDQGNLVRLAHKIKTQLKPVFILKNEVPAFMHHEQGTTDNRDLSGYIDGTENPQGDDAKAAAVLSGLGAGLDGSTFMAVQQWEHDLDKLAGLMARHETDAIIGRRLSDNEQIDDRPASSHVSRTDQESFEPEAHIFRNSMPWSIGERSGLMFSSFVNRQAAFNVQWRRMVGVEDGITDGLFKFTRPISSTCFWMPPMKDGKIDLSFLIG